MLSKFLKLNKCQTSESISEINNIIDTVKTGKKLEGQEFTNGNFNKII